MLKKDLRLKRNKDFSYLYRKGAKFKGQYVSIYTLKGYHCVKVGFSLSRKVGKAVVRNLFRRRLQDIFRKELANLRPNKYVVVALPHITKATYEDLEKDIHSLIEKINS